MTKIYYKNKTPLIEYIEKEIHCKVLKDKSLLGKLFSSKEFADLYFHQGILDEDALERIKNAKISIVNSFKVKQDILKQTNLDDSKVEVIYPALNEIYLKPKESKEKICEEFGFDKEKKIILFTAKNFKTSGAKEFLDIIKSLNYKNIQVIMAGDAKQIYTFKFQFAKYNLDEKVLLIEDYKNINLLFSAADIFILPTHGQGFATNILKAMFFKTVVFISSNSLTREIVDVFATMNSPSDPSTAFKVDALLGRNEDLKLIKNQNKKLSEEFLLQRQIEKVKFILSKI